MLARYQDALRPLTDRSAFAASYAALGAQRNAKLLGIFTRLSRRDGKHGYLQPINRVWRLLEGDLCPDALAPVTTWFVQELHPDVHSRRPPTAERRGQGQ